MNETRIKESVKSDEEELAKWTPDSESQIPSSHLESNLLPPVGGNSMGSAERSSYGQGQGTSVGNSSSIQADSQNVTGEADERGRKLETQNTETGAYSYDPKVPETAT